MKVVSILVSYWMGWESLDLSNNQMLNYCFNPSFLLDGLGIISRNNSGLADPRFNPSFLLDGLGIQHK